jgi:hypothetical protein
LYYEELARGIIIVYFQKYNKNEEPYPQPLHKTLYESEDMKNDLRAIAAVPRRAANGDTLKQSSKSVYAWKQVILLPDEPDVDEHGMETPCDIPPVVENLLKYCNSPEMQGEFSYGCKAAVCEDKTKFPKRQVDRAFLDKEVVNLMVYLHQDSLASMKRYMMIFVHVLDQH